MAIYFIDSENREVPLSQIKLPNVGDEGIFKSQESKKKFKRFKGVVLEKYRDEHIVVKNLKNGCKESFFRRDFLTQQVRFEPMPLEANMR